MNPKSPGIIPGVYHQIVLNAPENEVQPWKEAPRRSAPSEQAIMDEEVEMLIKNGIVEESNSEFCSNLVCVKKKDGSTRTCADLRRTNLLTKFDAQPIARIDESLDMLGKAKFLTSLDNSSVFWSVLMHPDAKKYTAFATCSRGQLQFKRMPFGLKNATATYARALNHCLRGLV